LTVLISSAGRRVELMAAFREAAENLEQELRVIGADFSPHLSAACRRADTSFQVPRCTGTDFITVLVDICRREQVALLVPTIDTELAVLAAHAEAFAAIGTRVVVASPSVVDIARDKLRTATVLSAAGINVPRTAVLQEFLDAPQTWQWPVVLKPIGGSSSIGLKIAEDIDDVRRAGAQRDDYLVQELWRGREYTVNVFFDRSGALRCAVPHLRIETRGGEVSKGRTEDVPVLRDAARKIAAALPGARGPLCFQAIVREDGAYAVFEINARFGGGYPLAHKAGARFTQWLLEETLGLPCTANDNWKPGVTMLRYDSAVFLGADE